MDGVISSIGVISVTMGLSHLRALCPSQITPLHSHINNFYVANHSIHTPITVTSNLDQLVSLNQSMKNFIFLKSCYSLTQLMENFYFNLFLNDRILLIFTVLLTLGHTWYAYINVIHVWNNNNLLFYALPKLPLEHVCD